VPHDGIRPSSSPARLVQNVVLPMYCQGVASRISRSSMPASRSVSMVRWLVMCARGVSESRPYLVTSRVSVP
jgi:hypothetical protein